MYWCLNGRPELEDSSMYLSGSSANFIGLKMENQFFSQLIFPNVFLEAELLHALLIMYWE